jgi:L-2-hydroxyglutarate oxidase
MPLVCKLAERRLRFGKRLVSSAVFDFAVIGAGIVGVNIAWVLRQRYPTAKIVVLDKELQAGQHASGRNSGVIHAGFYYTADSLKARYTRKGNQFLSEYCERKGIPLKKCGKVVVARTESDLAGLDVLYHRAIANEVPVECVSESQLRAIDPIVKSHKRALWSPTTSVSDPRAVLDHQILDLKASGVEIRWGAGVAAIHVHDSHLQLQLSNGDGISVLEAGHVVNAAGLYADKIARSLGFAHNLKIMPFIGLYLYCDVPLKTLVYPVPELSKPFLGVHFTCTVDGKVKIGPTAIPAFWREQYSEHGWLQAFSAREFLEVAGTGGAMLACNPDLRKLAIEEVKKYNRTYMIKGASELVHGLSPRAFGHYGKPGIRAQLVRTDTMALEMDYVVQGDAKSTHVLNAVSPAWTCSRPFAEHVCNFMKG